MTPFGFRVPTYLYKDADPMKIESLVPEFIQYLLEVYADNVLRELSRDPRYNKRWMSHSDEFKSDMLSRGYPTELHFSKESICDMFSVKKYPYTTEIDISPRKRLGRGTLENYLRLVEYGTSRYPARYLFTPARRDIEKNLRYYWDTFFATRVEDVPPTRKPTHYELYMRERRIYR